MGFEGSKLTRYEDVARQLEQIAEALSPGEKLPSVRDLMRQYNVSQATIDRSLDLLIRNDLVERVPGRGIFVAEKFSSQKSLHVDMCFFFKESTLIHNPCYSEMTSRLLEEAHKHQLHLNMFVQDQMGDISHFRQRIDRSNPDAVILMCVNKLSFELTLRHSNIPSVLLFPNTFDNDSTSLMIDNQCGVALAVEHLQQLGHDKIAFLHGQGFQGWYMLDQEERLEAFYVAMKSHGLLVPGSFVRYGGFTFDEGYAAVGELWQSRTRPTAIICNDYNARGVIKAVRAKGLRVPEDVSVVGFDDISHAALNDPPLTTIGVRWQKIAAKTIGTISQILSGEKLGGQKILTPVEIAVRETTLPCSAAKTLTQSISSKKSSVSSRKQKICN